MYAELVTISYYWIFLSLLIIVIIINILLLIISAYYYYYYYNYYCSCCFHYTSQVGGYITMSIIAALAAGTLTVVYSVAASLENGHDGSYYDPVCQPGGWSTHQHGCYGSVIMRYSAVWLPKHNIVMRRELKSSFPKPVKSTFDENLEWNLDLDNSGKYISPHRHVYKFCQRNLFFSEVPKVDLTHFGNKLFNLRFYMNKEKQGKRKGELWVSK